ncbi:MAG: DegT/DnrJ/EryC1/StrS family aminotransferase [Bryobacteraceae bacterium]|nr:DegT/DnrJ/EryC1/StrS family aminotransferase [Bryobacteraceae bacterium]
MTTIATRTVPLLDLRAQHATIRDEILAAVTRLLDAQSLILGEEVKALEREVAEYCGTKYAIGCASGTDALLLALMAFDVGPGDEVLTVPYSFFSTASVIHRLGARPVFVDVLPDTFNMDPALLAEALRRHPKAKAILPVHLFGACADMDPILELARQYGGIPVIEDAAQAVGAEYQGRRAGSMGAVGCFSFYPSKNLGGAGDGGMLTTDDGELAARLFALRVHGSKVKYVHEWVGLNSRLDALQAGVLRVKLRHLDEWTAARQRNAALYAVLLRDCAAVTLPVSARHSTRHVINQFVIRSARRDALQAHLSASGIGTEIYYPIPLHLQECFRGLGYREGDLPVSERLATEALALPVYPELPEESLRYVAERIGEFSGDER